MGKCAAKTMVIVPSWQGSLSAGSGIYGDKSVLLNECSCHQISFNYLTSNICRLQPGSEHMMEDNSSLPFF